MFSAKILVASLLFQTASVAESPFDKYIWAVVLLFITNGVTYYFSRPKTESEIIKSYAETIKTLVSAAKEQDERNTAISEKVDFVRTSLSNMREVLDDTKQKLADCLDRDCESCADCKKIMAQSLIALVKTEKFLTGNAEAFPLLNDIKALTDVLKSKTETESTFEV